MTCELVILSCEHYVIRLLYNNHTRRITYIRVQVVFGQIMDAVACLSNNTCTCANERKVLTRALV